MHFAKWPYGPARISFERECLNVTKFGPSPTGAWLCAIAPQFSYSRKICNMVRLPLNRETDHGRCIRRPGFTRRGTGRRVRARVGWIGPCLPAAPDRLSCADADRFPLSPRVRSRTAALRAGQRSDASAWAFTPGSGGRCGSGILVRIGGEHGRFRHLHPAATPA